jgi:hypothetical protein
MDNLFTGFGIRLRVQEAACQQEKKNSHADQYMFFH